MAPWSLLASAAALVLFPQQRGSILIASVAVAALREGGKGSGRGSGRENGGGSGSGSGSESESGSEREGEGEEEVGPGSEVVQVTLEWSDVTCVLQDKKREMRKILEGVSGAARPGRLLAIMGPSGAGKTVLLNALACQLPRQKNVSLFGEIRANGVSREGAIVRQAYVRQEDIFFSQLTVRETLLLAAKLQLPAKLSEGSKILHVDRLIHQLGLVNSVNTIVGDAKVRGVSGGEKKRLSIACELLGGPSLIFCDEPTTGLDAFQAGKVMSALHKLAEEGRTVICSLHQARSSVYGLLDDALLLAGGRALYFGPAGTSALGHFAEHGYNCPLHVNPAEFLSDLISIDFSSEETEKSSRERVASLASLFAKRERSEKRVVAGEGEGEGGRGGRGGRGGALVASRGGTWSQFKLLLGRAWRQTTRDKATNNVRAAINFFSALLFGSIFWRMGFGQTSIQDRMGLLQVAAINTAMASLTRTLGVFPRERVVTERERARGAYGAGPYFAGRLLAELPVGALFPLLFGGVVYPMAGLHASLGRFGKFLGIVTLESFAASAFGLAVGALAPNPEAAVAMGPSMMTVFIVFGGYYVNSENTPKFFRWIPNVSLIRWAFEALCVNEFRGLKFEARKQGDARTGEQVLARLSFEKSTVQKALWREGQILLFLYSTTFYLLKKKKLESQPLLPATSYSSLPGVREREGEREGEIDEEEEKFLDALNAASHGEEPFHAAEEETKIE